MLKNNKEDYFFQSRISSIVQIVNEKNYPKYSYFLDEHQICLAKHTLQELKCKNYDFYGSDKNYQRLMLCVYPDYLDKDNLDWPIKFLRFSYNKNYKLSHKDFLGALMSLQIKRELIGDIKVSDGIAEILVHQNCCDFIINNINKVGNVGVLINIVDNLTIDTELKFKDISGTIASFRIDNIVALLTKLSRSKAVEIIKSSRVNINYKEILNPSCVVNFGDVVTIRGYGKYIITDRVNETKKGRYYVTIQKYI